MAQTAVQIRYAVEADARLLAEVGAQTFTDTYAADNTPENLAMEIEESFSEAIQAAELADAAVTFLIAEAEAQIAGYAKLHRGHTPAGVAGQRPMEIARIYTVKEWIGRGVGAALMQACLREAAHQGCDVVWLGVWQHNPRAIAFYRKWGFEVVGTHPFHFGADPQTDWLMARGPHPPTPVY